MVAAVVAAVAAVVAASWVRWRLGEREEDRVSRWQYTWQEGVLILYNSVTLRGVGEYQPKG